MSSPDVTNGRQIKIGDEYFEVLAEDAGRVLAQGEPFVIVDVKKEKLVVKEGELFLYSDIEGNVAREDTSGLGLYYQDTRFLSTFNMTLLGSTPVLLSSTADRGFMSQIELTNADFMSADGTVVPQETINIRRIRVINDKLYELVRIKNYNHFPVDVSLQIEFDSDFADMFEVRGTKRTKYGIRLAPKVAEDSILLAYHGLDAILRKTMIRLETPPSSIEGTTAVYRFQLKPRERRVIKLSVEPVLPTTGERETDFNRAIGEIRKSYEAWFETSSQIVTDNELFTAVLRSSQRDIRMLWTSTEMGHFLSAGVPWFVTPFGRDTLITCLQIMMLDPHPARETARVFTQLQGRTLDHWRDEEPGKIFHEVRRGELANIRAIPHTPYFGSADATALYLVLVSDIVKWTGDLEFARSMVDSIDMALAWIDTYGDADGDGFVEYETKSRRGLINQGWKDSGNSVVHTDGRLAGTPIALSEVQAYVYYAKRRMSQLFDLLGDRERAAGLARQAEELKKKFNEVFWMEKEGFFALALDGDKNPVRTVTSNPAHGLWARIVDEEKASVLAGRLMQPDMFSGWGIRTMSKSSINYNPMSYHNGSVWPHDNSLIIRGLKKYGFNEEAERVATGLFEAALHYDYYRLPELFCGFTKRSISRPVSYPVACSPQAWAAGSMFMILQALLGIEADAPANTLYVESPMLPRWLKDVDIKSLRVGKAAISLKFRRDGEVTSFVVTEKVGNIRTIVTE
ncbi:MAG: amylo-alpha-1,6-glucosidase [Thermoleophilia bacterium]|nr:amylo-alpha-1,6-glucosidase [Thermoleophilia bacterium]